MFENERWCDERETVRAIPKSRGNQADKSNGKGDDDLEKASVGGHKPSEASKGAQNNPTQDPPDDGGFTDGSPKDRI